MPLEIRELVIKARVGKNETTAPEAGNSEEKNAEISLNEIVAKVLEVIKEKTER